MAVHQDTPLIDAVKVMQAKNIGGILIKNSEDKVIGIFTERDLLNRMDYDNPERLKGLRIKDLMTRDLITIEHTVPYNVVLDVMKAKNLRHMPITQEGRVVGIVSLRDMMHRYEENLEGLLRQKESQLMENLSRIRESEERFRTIFDNSAVAIMFADTNEILVAWNPLTEELLGLDGKELSNKPVAELYPPEEWQRIRSQRMRQFGSKHNMEVKIRKKSGEVIDVDLSVSVLRDPAGIVTGTIGIMKDISERKKAEVDLLRSREQLELANRELGENTKVLKEMILERDKTNRQLRETQRQIIQIEKMATIGTLAAGFAHEIKNPLAIILQGMEKIEKHFLSQRDEARVQYLKIIKDAAQRANNVVVSILQYSRGAEVEIKPVNVYDAIDAAIELILATATKQRVLIQKHYHRVAHLVSGNAVMLEQVFFDLFNNAVDAMPDGGEIDVTVDFVPNREEDKEGDFVIKVKDTGIGIETSQLTKIFDPFYTTKEVGKGTGLGLSTVFLIINKHEGHIAVESQKGRGTTFTITLPTA